MNCAGSDVDRFGCCVHQRIDLKRYDDYAQLCHDQKKKKGISTLPKSQRLRAEFSSEVVCGLLGIETGNQNLEADV